MRAIQSAQIGSLFVRVDVRHEGRLGDPGRARRESEQSVGFVRPPHRADEPVVTVAPPPSSRRAPNNCDCSSMSSLWRNAASAALISVMSLTITAKPITCPAALRRRNVRSTHVARRPVLVGDPVIEHDLVARERALHIGLQRRPGGATEHLARVKAANPLGRIAEPATVALVGPDVATVTVHVGDQRRQRVRDEPQLLLTFI